MILTITYSGQSAHVFYPYAGDERCTAALLLEVDPIGLVRNRRGPSGEGYALDQYVNDRPYVTSSFMSVAIARVFGTAMSGKSKERQSLADAALPLSIRMPVVPCRGGEDLLRRLFEPLGYRVSATQHILDQSFPEWGQSRYFGVELEATVRMEELLAHLYVLLPVLDDDKHYRVGDDEIEKLLRRGEGWLREHPERELITKRYLKHQKWLANEALERLVGEEDPEAEEAAAIRAGEEEKIERPISLAEQRIGAVLAALRASNAKRIVDLGCGEGRLLRELLKDKTFTEIVGMDVSHRSLEIAADKLKLDRLPRLQQERIRLMHGSLTYRDRRLSDFDAATVVEVVEHQDPPRLAAFERVLFEFARPKTVVLTTPNVEYNVKFATLPAGKFRHKDHRFEWTRSEFQHWATVQAERFGYSVHYLAIGDEDSVVGSPTQMGIFSLK